MTEKKIYPGLPDTVSTQEMCKLLGIGPRSLRDMAAKGKIVQAPQKGRYFTSSIATYCENLRELVTSRKTEGGIDILDERAKTEQIKRQIAEIELKRARGDTLDAEEVSEAWGGLARTFQVMVMGIAGKARGRIPHLTAHDAETLKDLCRESLELLAEEVEDGAVIGASPEALGDGKR